MTCLKKRLWLASISVTVVALGMIMLVAFFAGGTTNTSTPQGSTQSGVPELNVKAPDSHYLLTSPYFPNSTYKITKIFLESATPWIGYSNSSIAVKVGINVPQGTSVLIVNGTIRNDYTAEEILQWSQEGVGDCYIGLDAYLYNKQGNLVSIIERGNPFRGCYEVSLKGGETASYNMVFVANSDDVAYFEIYVSYLRPIPQF